LAQVVIARVNSDAKEFIDQSDILTKYRSNIRIVKDSVDNTIRDRFT
jgi:hypothetical protein